MQRQRPRKTQRQRQRPGQEPAEASSYCSRTHIFIGALLLGGLSDRDRERENTCQTAERQISLDSITCQEMGPFPSQNKVITIN